MARFVTCEARSVDCSTDMTQMGFSLDGIYGSSNESWRWEGCLRGVFLSTIPALHLIGCFHPTTTDSPFQPDQLVKKGLSCSASFSSAYQRQIYLIVKNVQQYSGESSEGRGGAYSTFLNLPLSLLQC